MDYISFMIKELEARIKINLIEANYNDNKNTSNSSKEEISNSSKEEVVEIKKPVKNTKKPVKQIKVVKEEIKEEPIKKKRGRPPKNKI